MGVIVADSTIDLTHNRYGHQLYVLTSQARDDIREFLAHGRGRSDLAVSF